MNSKDLVINTLHGIKTEKIPVCPHWWGVYKHEFAAKQKIELAIPEGKSVSAKQLADICSVFYEYFKPDWFHLGSKQWIIDPLSGRRKLIDKLGMEAAKLVSKKIIDEFIAVSTLTSAELIKTGTYEHVKLLAKKYGNTSFICVNEGNPICGVLDPSSTPGFENGLIAMLEKPKMFEYFVFRIYEAALNRIIALKECGARGYIGSETYIGADLISPSLYKELVFPAHKYFYKKTKTLGLEPIAYITGDVLPLLPLINTLDISALMVEDPKKNFKLDIIDIRKNLSGKIALFGNLDSVETLWRGTIKQVREETLRELQAAKSGPFIMANGSPIALDTPAKNIKEMIDTVKSF